jgi:hypothetical protein
MPEDSQVGVLLVEQLTHTLSALRRRMRVLRWAVPLSMMLLVIAYEAFPGPWLLREYGLAAHTTAELLLFGTLGPVLAFIVLDFFGRWLDERDTSDLQAQLMAQARADVIRSRALVDDAVQALFSAGALIGALQVEAEQQGVDTTAVPVPETQRALDAVVADLRAHLQAPPHWVDRGQ